MRRFVSWAIVAIGYGLLGYAAFTGSWWWFTLIWFAFSGIGYLLEVSGWLNLMWQELGIDPITNETTLSVHVAPEKHVNWRVEGF